MTDASHGSSWRATLALTSLAAAGIHFAVMGEHFQEALSLGLFFAVVAWAQALFAMAILIGSSRALLLAGLAGNAAVVATWAASRTSGLPVGPTPWTAEPVGGADLVSTALELVIVAGCGILLARGTDRIDAPRRGWIPVLALALSLIVITSAAVATKGEHAHEEAAAHPHAPEAANEPDGHAHTLVGGSGEPNPLQFNEITEAMAKYEDVHVAWDEGWYKEHEDWPGTGSHFVRDSDWDESGPANPGLDIYQPEFLMYSRFLTGKWKLVAVAYVVDQELFPEPPTNLKGAQFHEHVWNCIVDGEELEEEDWGVLSREECDIMGGRWSPGGAWMTHVWFVENPDGVFAEENPTLI